MRSRIVFYLLTSAAVNLIGLFAEPTAGWWSPLKSVVLIVTSGGMFYELYRYFAGKNKRNRRKLHS